MIYTFMNKNVPVFKLDMSLEPLELNSSLDLYNPEFLPVNVGYKQARNEVNLKDFREWLRHRRQPEYRQNLDKLLSTLNINDIDDIMLENYGLNAIDQYWFREEGDDITWDEINYFNNELDTDLGEVIFEQRNDVKSWKSADAVTDGFLKKTWVKREGELILLKANSAPLFEETANEIFAAKVASMMSFDHVEYWSEEFAGTTVSACRNMIDENSELITLKEFTAFDKEWNSTHDFHRLIRLAQAAGVEDIRRRLEDMIILDYLIANEDRHQRNIALIRDVNTLNFTKLAPLFDHGNSMHRHTETDYIMKAVPRAMPFARTHYDQIKLVRLRRYDFDRLGNLTSDLLEIYSNTYMDKVDPNRKHVLAEAVKDRVQRLVYLQHKEQW